MIKRELVSTIIPVFNRPRMIVEAVESVLGQSHRPIEIIIVDDGSSDETPEVLAELARRSDCITVVRTDNQGPGRARETGRSLARGELIQYLDSDDILLPAKFERQAAALRENPECGACYGWTRYRHADGRVEPRPWKGSGRRVETMFPSFLESRWWDTPTPLYRKRVCDAAGPWSNLRLEEDWEYDCRVAATGVALAYVEEFVAEVRDHESGRLCRGTALDASRLATRARAHFLILESALRAGIAPETPERQHFARELFLLARQCAAAGLKSETWNLLDGARVATGKAGRRWDINLYQTLSRLIGTSTIGRLATWSDRFRITTR
ncbi:MAG TPA: glycosyltransferase family A protein [Thermoanaerobaculia bacterium]|nr:glycosyltransferase family A protein [Thermoanaerobaculia bacterium]